MHESVVVLVIHLDPYSFAFFDAIPWRNRLPLSNEDLNTAVSEFLTAWKLIGIGEQMDTFCSWALSWRT